MKKVFQTIYGLFRKSGEGISNTLDKEESDKAADEFIKKSAEIKEELQKKIEKTNQELQERFNKNNKESSKKSITKKKVSNTKKTASAKKAKDNSKKETKKKTPSNKKSTTSKNIKSTTKKKTVTKKTVSKTKVSKTVKETTSYPSGLIVNSKILTSVERGYLELAGFKNYKDVLINLETPSKRNSIAKKVTTTSGVLNTIVKKIEMLQIKGVSEKTAIALIRIGINTTSKLEKLNVETTMKKIVKFKKENPKSEISLSKKQLENLISNSNK